MRKLAILKVVGALCALLLLPGAVSANAAAAGKKKAASRASHHSPKKTVSRSHRTSKSRRTSRSRRRGNWRRRGQQAIKADRAREIQQALIREHYLTGEPSGAWDARTKQAMAKYQADHGWQTKKLPDSRALIELGLGPTHEGLLNPQSVASSERPATATSAPDGNVRH